MALTGETFDQVARRYDRFVLKLEENHSKLVVSASRVCDPELAKRSTETCRRLITAMCLCKEVARVLRLKGCNPMLDGELENIVEQARRSTGAVSTFFPEQLVLYTDSFETR